MHNWWIEQSHIFYSLCDGWISNDCISVFWILCWFSHMLVLSSEVRVEGLETLDYLDNLKNRERFTEQGDAIVFESEVSICFLQKCWLFSVPFQLLFIQILCGTCFYSFLWRWTKYISEHLPKLLFWTMKGREHLNCGKMDFLMLVSENFLACIS